LDENHKIPKSNWKMVYIEVRWYNIKYIKVKLTLLSGIKCTAKIYHTVGTVHIHVYINPRKLLENLKQIACGRKKYENKRDG
jgi:hypothetical protein